MTESVMRTCMVCLGASYRAPRTGAPPAKGCPECGGTGMVEVTDPVEAAEFTAKIDALNEGLFRQAERKAEAYAKRWGGHK